MYTCFMHSGRFWEGIELRTMLIKPRYSMDDTRLRCVSFIYLWEVTIILSISHRGVWKNSMVSSSFAKSSCIFMQSIAVHRNPLTYVGNNCIYVSMTALLAYILKHYITS